ncbi:MAG: NAD(P)-binding domain-containing protein, partial [Desulfobacterales bacterium]|nr:NAD(P)-binding domain-containing protein [Desulfobacterales bacterium]
MAKLNRKTGFIGAGNMAEAFIGAVIRAGIIPSSMIYASDVNSERLSMLKKTYGISVTDDNFKVFSMCDIVVLAVKPQQMPDVLSQITSRNDYG